MWIEAPTDGFDIESRPLGLYVAAMVAAVGTLLLLPAFGPVVETAQSAATALFA
jgi:NADH-quinone oxidoreductase subunit N